MSRLLTGVFGILLTVISASATLADQNSWPRTLPLSQGMVTIYALQVDEMKDDVIKFRAALAYRSTAASEPIFGAGWFESRVVIDSTDRIVHPTDLKVTDTRFPAGTHDVKSELSDVLAQQSQSWNLDFSLDELEAELRTAQAKSDAEQNLNTKPPRIIYRDHPALLITMDGEPLMRKIENSPYQAVINTPYPLIWDGNHYYLNAARDVWYSAVSATGPYQFEPNPPQAIADMVNPDEAGTTDEQVTEAVTAANAPEVIVSTEPAELIVTEGPAAFVPLIDDLLVLGNSDDDVFMHVSSQDFYIVLAGRWYRSSSLNGPWAYQKADDLPAAFASIPKDSDQADSRVYVAGTEEAREALMDAEVPQTAAVSRGEVDIKVDYDGKPVYAPVDGTELVYIRNTGSTVLKSGGLYYLVENGVWYVSTSANGPWQVSDHRPAEVDTILPTSPVYNVKYVRVYDATPQVVYVGYTPGYTGSYVYRNTIFYGTGWYYRPWVSPHYYYPRFSTWGFHAVYDPWSGWNFGLGWGWGPFSVSYFPGGYWHHGHAWHHRYYGHWGPRGYWPKPVYRRNHHDRYSHNGSRRNASRHNHVYQNTSGDFSSGKNLRNANLYRDGSQQARIAATRDKKPRLSGRRDNLVRQADRIDTGTRRQQNYAGLKNGEQNRAGPVRRSDLRLKADLRDANSAASRSDLVADNDGNVYRKQDRSGFNGDAGKSNSLLRKSPGVAETRSDRGWITTPRESQKNSNRSNDRSGNRSGMRGVAQTGVTPLSRSSQTRPTPPDLSSQTSTGENPLLQNRSRMEPGSLPAGQRVIQPETGAANLRQRSPQLDTSGNEPVYSGSQPATGGTGLRNLSSRPASIDHSRGQLLSQPLTTPPQSPTIAPVTPVQPGSLNHRQGLTQPTQNARYESTPEARPESYQPKRGERITDRRERPRR